MEQRTPEWLAYRKNHIGASDSNVIMGHGFNRSVYDLWLEKIGMGKEVVVNQRMQRGIELEPIARDWAEREIGVTFKPVVRKSRLTEYMMASSDGWHDESNTLIEIKTSERLHESIPEYYLPQLHHLMYVFEVPEMIYVSYDGQTGRIFEIRRDDDYMQKLLEEEAKFWNCVNNFIEPSRNKRDYKERTDKEYQDQLTIYLNNKKQREFYEDLEKRSKEKLISMTDDNTFSMGCEIVQKIRQGNIDYKKLIEEHNIKDADKYRKEPIKFWEIRDKS